MSSWAMFIRPVRENITTVSKLGGLRGGGRERGRDGEREGGRERERGMTGGKREGGRKETIKEKISHNEREVTMAAAPIT